jgi:anti-sigma factor RsiW
MSDRVTCADGVELLLEYLEGTLAPAVSQALEAHVATCLRCAAFVASYRRTPRILRAATAVSLPDELALALRRFLAERR